jgi:hexosaminidase
LRFASLATVNFTAHLLAAVAKMFPSKYISTGGDEINEACYAADTQTQQLLNSTGQTFEQALSTFTVATHGALKQQRKTVVVWEGL